MPNVGAHARDDPANAGHGHGAALAYEATHAVAQEPYRSAQRPLGLPRRSSAVHLDRDRQSVMEAWEYGVSAHGRCILIVAEDKLL